jgi:arginine deiminase
VKKNVWVMMGLFSEKMNDEKNSISIEKSLIQKNEITATVMQFNKKDLAAPIHFSSLEALLRDISINDFGCEEVKIIFSGNNEYPYSAREQWTDSCNLLALKEGVVLSYDRNEKTNTAFEAAGFTLIKVKDLIDDLENDEIQIADIENTVILMPSSELSRARGGFHCMSMPIERSSI